LNEILDDKINTFYRVYLKSLDKFQESLPHNKTRKDVYIIIPCTSANDFRRRPRPQVRPITIP